MNTAPYPITVSGIGLMELRVISESILHLDTPELVEGPYRVRASASRTPDGRWVIDLAYGLFVESPDPGACTEIPLLRIRDALLEGIRHWTNRNDGVLVRARVDHLTEQIADIAREIAPLREEQDQLRKERDQLLADYPVLTNVVEPNAQESTEANADSR